MSSRVKSRRTALKAAAVLGLTLLYVVTFSVLFSAVGLAAGVFAAIPVLAVAWYYGPWAGLIAGVLTYPVNGLLITFTTDTGGLDAVARQGVVGTAATTLVGFIVGWLRDLGERTKRAEEYVQKQNKDLRELTERLINAQEEERRRLAIDLHDGPLQQALLLLSTTDDDNSIAVCRELVAELRIAMANLRPSILDDLGLSSGLEWLVETAARRSEISPTLSLDGVVLEDRFPSDVELGLFRVCQEAIANVVKHADTANLHVSLSNTDGWLVLEVRDDGKGFSPDSAGRVGVGLAGMRQRVNRLGGSFEVTSEPEKGTSVVARVPITADNQRPIPNQRRMATL